MEIELKGHSGCQVEIIQEQERLYICKGTTDPAYISRLQKQGEKQQHFSKEKNLPVKIPQITNIITTTGQCRIQMEYVYALNFIDFFERSGIKQIESSYETLENFILWEIKNSPVTVISSDIIHDKFQDIRNRLDQNKILLKHSELKKLFNASEPIYNHIKQIKIPVGKCHGDLTFSNVLFDGCSNHLIDFLDSFIETPLVDIVKLRQDTCHFWSERMYTGHYDPLRLHLIFNMLDKRIVQTANQFEWYREWYPIFQLLNFWRIVQYATEPHIIAYLENTIQRLIKDITFQKR